MPGSLALGPNSHNVSVEQICVHLEHPLVVSRTSIVTVFVSSYTCLDGPRWVTSGGWSVTDTKTCKACVCVWERVRTTLEKMVTKLSFSRRRIRRALEVAPETREVKIWLVKLSKQNRSLWFWTESMISDVESRSTHVQNTGWVIVRQCVSDPGYDSNRIHSWLSSQGTSISTRQWWNLKGSQLWRDL